MSGIPARPLVLQPLSKQLSPRSGAGTGCARPGAAEQRGAAAPGCSRDPQGAAGCAGAPRVLLQGRGRTPMEPGGRGRHPASPAAAPSTLLPRRSRSRDAQERRGVAQHLKPGFLPAVLCRTAGTLPFFMIPSLHTRFLNAKLTALGTALGDAAGTDVPEPHGELERAQAPREVSPRWGRCNQSASIGAGSASQSQPASLHPARKVLWQHGKPQGALGTSTRHCVPRRFHPGGLRTRQSLPKHSHDPRLGVINLPERQLASAAAQGSSNAVSHSQGGRNDSRREEGN